MNENIQLEMNPSVKKQSSIDTSIALFSQDIDNYSFDITFTDLKLQAGDQVEVLAKLQGGRVEHKSSANLVEVDGELIARYIFDTKLISRRSHVFCYVYLKRGDKSADVGAFYFEVDLSELDKVGGKIAEVYDGRYEDLVADFEQALEDYKLTLPQADSVRADIDEILNQFSEDSQQVIGDLGELATTVEIAEASRVEKESERVQAETERKEAETLREDNYEQLIDTALIEADVVEKVDNKVTELTPQINDLTAQLAQTNSYLFRDTVTVNVPSDFPTLQDAFDSVTSNFYSMRASIDINIESGFKPKLGISLKKRDYRAITLTSTDAIVTLDDSFTGDFIRGSDCDFPLFDILVDMNKKGKFGIALYSNANVTVSPLKGVINAGDSGVFVNRMSRLYAHEGNFSGATKTGMFVDHANYVYARYANLSGCGGSGLRATKGSVVEIANADVSGCGGIAIQASEGSTVIGITDPSQPTDFLDISSSGANGVHLSGGSTLIADKIIATDCVRTTFYLSGASKLVCKNTIVERSTGAFTLFLGSEAHFEDGEINDITGTAIYCDGGSTFNAPNLIVTATPGVVCSFKNGSEGNLVGAKMLNSGTPIRATEGSRVNAQKLDATGHTSRHAFNVYTGSQINAVGALGSLRVPANTISSDGIIFQ